MFFPGAAVYMNKIACGPEAADAIDIDAPPGREREAGRKAKGVKPSDVTVVVLERDRHKDLIAELRSVEAQGAADPDGDVAPAIAAAQPRHGRRPADGDRRHAGGRSRGLGAQVRRRRVQGKLWPRNDEERQQLIDAGYDLDRVLSTDDLVGGNEVFFAATGVTTGALLRGVRYTADGAVTDRS